MVERLKREHEVEVDWRPFFLHPETPPEGTVLSPQARARYAPGRERLKQMAQAAGIPMVFSDLTPNTRRALEATEYARERGKLEEFHRIVFHKYYGEGQDVNAWDVLRAAAVEAGLDADEMQRDVDAGNYRRAVDVQTAEAAAMGISGVPTYVVNWKYGIVGAQPYEVFEQLIARLAAESEEAGPQA